MQIEKAALYLLIWSSRLLEFVLVNAAEPTDSQNNADLDAKFKKISQTLRTLEKIRDHDTTSSRKAGSKRVERGTTGPPVLVKTPNRHQSVITDDGSGALSDDDDYSHGGSGMEDPFDEESGDGPEPSVANPDDSDIGLEDVSTISARGPLIVGTPPSLSNKHVVKESTTTSASTSSATATASRASTTTKSTPRITTLRPTPSTTKKVTLSHIESPEYNPKQKSPNSGAAIFVPHRTVVLLIVLCSIRWLWRS